MEDKENKTFNAFNELFKVKILREMLRFETEVGWKITRDCINDKNRAIDFIKYGFEEGLKFAKQSKSVQGEKN